MCIFDVVVVYILVNLMTGFLSCLETTEHGLVSIEKGFEIPIWLVFWYSNIAKRFNDINAMIIENHLAKIVDLKRKH